MKFYISDLHMGDGSKKEDFKLDKELISFIDYIKQIGGELYLVGDTFDMWQSRLRDIVEHHQKSIDEIVSINATFITGNHDYELSLLKPILKINVVSEVISCDTMVLHGNIFDKYNNPKSKIGAAVTKLAGLLESVHPDIDLLGKLWRSNKEYYQPLYKLAAKLVCSRIIFGHTHKEEIVNYNEMQIANTGNWAEGKMPYIKDDCGKLTLNYWK